MQIKRPKKKKVTEDGVHIYIRMTEEGYSQ